LHTIFLTLRPVIYVIWSWLLLGELPTLVALIGGTAAITGVIIVTISKSKDKQKLP
jgi:drug/metabolite transporter (DMT)-like permease